MRTFKRESWNKYKRLGKGAKKKITWRKARGRHNKIRENIKGHQNKPSIGMKKTPSKKIILINNMKELLGTNEKVIILSAKIGAKKKALMVEEAKKKGIKIKNNKERNKTSK
ncbi:hypothetical protein COU61_00135 [Candidatus Pacearchaeota archaeon CG10_big_fil_rev_8_21_14_0_10_35_13]|nr:MAG: hypothetical protein COU61_00135 [Candidatus Pacearchaeota archaeon CG10_big_fil_rev_8_21_14_0_10_35_13]